MLIFQQKITKAPIFNYQKKFGKKLLVKFFLKKFDFFFSNSRFFWKKFQNNIFWKNNFFEKKIEKNLTNLKKNVGKKSFGKNFFGKKMYLEKKIWKLFLEIFKQWFLWFRMIKVILSSYSINYRTTLEWFSVLKFLNNGFCILECFSVLENFSGLEGFIVLEFLKNSFSVLEF